MPLKLMAHKTNIFYKGRSALHLKCSDLHFECHTKETFDISSNVSICLCVFSFSFIATLKSSTQQTSRACCSDIVQSAVVTGM